ncbi:streptophobe family protein [Streptomyces sp. Ru87]|uniref:streptophobe family protein n=2 Tax=unclassified Streptomyces TaxID=2593676 RepID=UPI000BF6987A|nr:streptophobe family protein [Streptomyces sp. Ru87]PGH51066.1 hypothetical protein CRI70_08730 [Streptomyces sp. Ru87]
MSTNRDTSVPWSTALLTAVAAVSWSFLAMSATAALALHLLGADAAGSLGPMSAAAVVLSVNGRVVPSGNAGILGLEGARAEAAVDIAPLGVGLVGALLLAWIFLRSLRSAGTAPAELAARAGAVLLVFLAMLAAFGWAGNDTVTIDGSALPLGDLGDMPDIGLPDEIAGLLPDDLGDGLAGLGGAEVTVAFRCDMGATLAGGALWAAGVLLLALLVSRRVPLPRGWEAAHRTVRPAAAAVCSVLLLAVAAGWAAACWAAAGDDHPARIFGSALLCGPNGVWLGLSLGLFVPWRGLATGELARVLPDPLDRLLTGSGSERPVGVLRLAELDGRVWWLVAAAAAAMLCAGVLTAVRTPPGGSRAAFALRCGTCLGVATAVALPPAGVLADVDAAANVSVLGFEAFGTRLGLHASAAAGLLLGALWGAAAGAAGALLTAARNGFADAVHAITRSRSRARATVPRA